MRSNRIIYVIAILLAIATFLWSGSYLSLSVALALAILAIVLLVGVFLTKSLGQVDISIPSSFQVGDTAHIEISTKAGLPFVASLIGLDIKISSHTFQLVEHRKASVALNTSSRRKVQIPLNSNRYGRMGIEIEKCWCEDALRLFRISLPWTKTQECVVYPAPMGLVTNLSHVPLSRSFGTTYDESNPGSDVDEIFDIREFQAGDHLASVHWKLSTKFDTMVSKQYSRPVDFELVVVSLASLAGMDGEKTDAEVLNGIASACGAICADFLHQGFPHNFSLPVNGEFESIAIDGLDSLGIANETILDAPISGSYSDAVSCMMASELAEHFTKCILVTSVYDEHFWVQLVAEMDLSVVLVGSGTGTNDVEGDYKLIMVDTKDADNNERTISL